MNENKHNWMLGPVMFWTVLTTLFAWLPLVRIMGRPEGYTWSIAGLSGEGLSGPFWIFIPLTGFAVTLLLFAGRGPRRLFYPMLILWQLTVTGVLVAGVIQDGGMARFQGQGLHLMIPLWIFAALSVIFTVLSAIWVLADRRQPPPELASWSTRNTFRLVTSLSLLLVGLVLFRLGTNYNWVTALAIIFTITHWITLAWSFEAVHEQDRRQRMETGASV